MITIGRRRAGRVGARFGWRPGWAAGAGRAASAVVAVRRGGRVQRGLCLVCLAPEPADAGGGPWLAVRGNDGHRSLGCPDEGAGQLHPEPAQAREPVAAPARGADQPLQSLPEPGRARPPPALGAGPAAACRCTQRVGRNAARPGRPVRPWTGSSRPRSGRDATVGGVGDPGRFAAGRRAKGRPPRGVPQHAQRSARTLTLQPFTRRLRFRISENQRPPPARSAWMEGQVYEVLDKHAWVEPGETVSDELLLNLGVSKFEPAMLKARLVWHRRRGNITVSAKQIIPAEP